MVLHSKKWQFGLLVSTLPAEEGNIGSILLHGKLDQRQRDRNDLGALSLSQDGFMPNCFGLSSRKHELSQTSRNKTETSALGHGVQYVKKKRKELVSDLSLW